METRRFKRACLSRLLYESTLLSVVVLRVVAFLTFLNAERIFSAAATGHGNAFRRSIVKMHQSVRLARAMTIKMPARNSRILRVSQEFSHKSMSSWHAQRTTRIEIEQGPIHFKKLTPICLDNFLWYPFPLNKFGCLGHLQDMLHALVDCITAQTPIRSSSPVFEM